MRALLRSADHWETLWREAGPRRELERRIGAENRDRQSFTLFGFCDVCRAARRFECDWKGSDGVVLDLRERLICQGCELNCRQRLVFQLGSEFLAGRDSASLFAYEQVTAFYRALTERYSAFDVVGSEYLGEGVVSGSCRDGLRHESALALSFPDARFDVLFSNDVFEHVPDIQRTLAEAARVLKPGGRLIATMPFSFQASTLQRARLVEGRIEHLATPEYHENPLSGDGALAFYTFGWDLLDLCRAAGLVDPRFVCRHSMFRAYLGGELGLVLCAEKPAAPTENRSPV
jgi:SAM-dependent methyltransferase